MTEQVSKLYPINTNKRYKTSSFALTELRTNVQHRKGGLVTAGIIVISTNNFARVGRLLELSEIGSALMQYPDG